MPGSDRSLVRQLRRVAARLGVRGAIEGESPAVHLQRQDALVREVRKFRALIETGSDGVVLLDRDLMFQYASPSITRLLGFPIDEIVGRRALDFVDADDRDRLGTQLSALAQTPRAFVAVTFRVRAHAGGTRWMAAEVSNLLDDADVGAIVSKYRDVTDARAASGALESEVADRKRIQYALEKLSHAIEQTADSVMITDCDGVIEYVNPAFETMTGFTRHEAIGRTPRLLNSGKQSQRFYETLWSTILRGQVFRVIVTNKTKDGRLYDEDQTITPVRDEGGIITHFVSTGRDITQRRRTQEALRRLNEQFESEATRIAGVLHDEAGQFLTSAHLLLADIAHDVDPAVRDRLKEVRSTLDQVEEQLRRVSHEIHPRVVEDLGLTEAIRFLAGAFSRRTKIAITVDTAIAGPYPRALETVLYRLVQEALTNISRHAKATAGSVKLFGDADSVQCCISDNGIGFNDGATSRGEAGLGLRLIQDRLAVVGGTLTITSAPGQGTELRAFVALENNHASAHSAR